MLHKLPKTKSKKKKRIGRGYGSAKGGHTVGKGTKGQKSRSGYKPPRRNFEGGQTPLFRRLPKRRGLARKGGRIQRLDTVVFNVGDFNDVKAGTVVDEKWLREKGLIKTKKRVKIKILGDGSLGEKIVVKGLKVSESAKAKIEKAGGEVKEI